MAEAESEACLNWSLDKGPASSQEDLFYSLFLRMRIEEAEFVAIGMAIILNLIKKSGDEYLRLFSDEIEFEAVFTLS